MRLLVLCLALAFVSAPGCYRAQDPATVAEARPELALGYELAFKAWSWLDSYNSALYETQANVVIKAIADSRDAFVAECGEDGAEHCMLAAYNAIMADWEKESGYDVRTRQLETARNGLRAMSSVLGADPNGGAFDWAGPVLAVASALNAIAKELEASGVDLPDVVVAGVEAIGKLS